MRLLRRKTATVIMTIGLSVSTAMIFSQPAETPAVNPNACIEMPKGELTQAQLKELVPDNLPGRVFIRWRTETQEDNYGFNIYRADKPDGQYKKVNKSIIPGEGSTNIPRDYCYMDTPLPRGETFYYYIESVSTGGVAEVMKDTKGAKVKVKTVEEEREWLRKKALGIDTATSATATSTSATTDKAPVRTGGSSAPAIKPSPAPAATITTSPLS